MKTVVLVRKIFDQMTSRLFQAGFGIDRQEEFLNSSYFEEVIRFCNSWGRQVERSENCIVIRYEDLVDNPVGTLRVLCDFWGLEISDEHLERSVDLCRRDIMLDKVPATIREKNIRVSSQKHKFDEVFTGENVERIKDTIKEKLAYDFEYAY